MFGTLLHRRCVYERVPVGALVRRSELAARLEAIPDFPEPDAAQEQYVTPADIAAALILEAEADGCIRGRTVLDLGCGTGVLSLAAYLLGASVHGVDADAGAVAIAKAAVPDGHFEVADLAAWEPPRVDTVVMNPPFGAQKRHADRIFYARAAQALRPGGTCWFLAQTSGEAFLQRFWGDLGASLERVEVWDYPLPARFAFHDRDVAVIRVGGYCATMR